MTFKDEEVGFKVMKLLCDQFFENPDAQKRARLYKEYEWFGISEKEFLKLLKIIPGLLNHSTKAKFGLAYCFIDPPHSSWYEIEAIYTFL